VTDEKKICSTSRKYDMAEMRAKKRRAGDKNLSAADRGSWRTRVMTSY
jgi:hypothetical protein